MMASCSSADFSAKLMLETSRTARTVPSLSRTMSSRISAISKKRSVDGPGFGLASFLDCIRIFGSCVILLHTLNHCHPDLLHSVVIPSDQREPRDLEFTHSRSL